VCLSGAVLALLGRVRADGRFAGLVAEHAAAFVAAPHFAGRGMNGGTSFQVKLAVLLGAPPALALMGAALHEGGAGSVAAALARAAGSASPEQIALELFTAALRVYAAAPADNFFLTHGVTAAWCVGKLLPHYAAAGGAALLDALTSLVAALVGVYVADGMPALDAGGGGGGDDGAAVPGWDAVVAVALNAVDDTDEHTFKLVMNCQEVAARAAAVGDAAGGGVATELELRRTAARKAGAVPW
jgi:hypothetical protein